MAPQQHTSHVLRWAVLGILCILICGCRSQRATVAPSIQFSRVPQADAGGPDKFDIIEGSVTGAHPGQQLVLYSRSGSWWVQPLVNQPFTKIQPNSKWTNSTHLGTEYAALLVNSGYVPPSRMNVLPPTGATVAPWQLQKAPALRRHLRCTLADTSGGSETRPATVAAA